MTDLGPVLLLPIGCPPWDDLEMLSHDLGAEGAVCTVSRSILLPSSVYDHRRNQYRANAFLDLAARAFPVLVDPLGKVLAVTEADLYANGLNFVLGMAESPGRTAVISLC